jgi:hypothetical protein
VNSWESTSIPSGFCVTVKSYGDWRYLVPVSVFILYADSLSADHFSSAPNPLCMPCSQDDRMFNIETWHNISDQAGFTDYTSNMLIAYETFKKRYETRPLKQWRILALCLEAVHRN